MTKYKITTKKIIIDENGIYIPEDVNNSDYQDYLKWVDAGNAPDPADPEPLREIALSPSQQIILADGIDVAGVIITGEPGATVEYTINGTPQSIALDPIGREAIELTSDTPGTVIVVQAGTARAVVYAVEVPS